jgi:hypothetical protein
MERRIPSISQERFLCLTKHQAMKTYGGADVYIPVFLTWALAGGEWSDSRPCRFNPPPTGRDHGTRLGGPQRRSGRYGEAKILDPTATRTPNPRSSSPQGDHYLIENSQSLLIKLGWLLYS